MDKYIRLFKPSKVVQLHISTKWEVCFFISKAMGKKRYCNECAFFKYEDAEGYGWCELLEEADVNFKYEACVEFEESEIKDIDYE